MIICIATPDDAEEIRRVHAGTWLATYPNPDFHVSYKGILLRVEGINGEKIAQRIETWRKQISSAGQDHAVFVAREQGRIAGFTAPAIQNGQRRIGALYVSPEAQGRGFGTKLLCRALDWHGDEDDVYVHVAEYNTKAIEFYCKSGFKLTGRRFEDEDGRLIGASIPELEMVRHRKGY